MEVTLRDIERLLDTQLGPINKNISGIKTVMAKLATSEELQSIKTDIADIKQTLNTHTAALEQLLTEKKTREENKTVEDDRVASLVEWAKQAGQKLGVEYKP